MMRDVQITLCASSPNDAGLAAAGAGAKGVRPVADLLIGDGPRGGACNMVHDAATFCREPGGSVSCRRG